MKKLKFVPVLMLALIFSTSAFAWTGDWNNYYPYAGGGPKECTPIAPGSWVQLIHAGPDGLVDDPKESWLAAGPLMADKQAALDAWLAGGAMPIGDDTLRDETVFLDYGPGWEGYFLTSISGGDEEQGDPLYIRYFTAPEGQIVECDWYRNVGDPEDPDKPIYNLVLDGWNGDNYENGEYVTYLEGVCADTHISVPEPATMAIGGIALLLGFFRRKK